jgi:putative Holliday junction resolvase
VLPARDKKKLLSQIVELSRAESVGRFVVGLPLDMKGGEGDAARRARALAQEIADATGCEVELWDERLSTVQARRALSASEVHGAKAKRRIDEAAAVEILQSWLDAHR